MEQSPEEWEQADRPPALWETILGPYMNGEVEFGVAYAAVFDKMPVLWNQRAADILALINGALTKRRLGLWDDLEARLEIRALRGKLPPFLMQWSGRSWLENDKVVPKGSD